MTEQLWFYELLMEEFGPVSAAEIRQLLKDGMLSSTDRVRTESSTLWMTVAEMSTVSEQSTSAAAREDSASQNLDDSGLDDRNSDLDIDAINLQGNSEDVDRNSDLDIDAFNLQGDSDVDDRNSNLDIDAFNLAGDSDSPLPAVSAVHKPPPFEPLKELTTEPEANYFVKSFGHILGPMPHADLIQMARSGAFSRGDEIRHGADGHWIAIETAPDVARRISKQELQEPAGDATASETVPVAKPPAVKKKKTKSSKPSATAKRRKKPKEDALLKEIFSEIFDEDGKVRPELERKPDPVVAPANSGTSEAPLGTVASAATGVGAGVDAPGTPASPAAAVPGGFSGQSTAVVPSPIPAAPPPRMPPPVSRPPTPKRAKSKASSGGGGGFTMPEPKILGIAGGGIALVLLLVGGFMGFIPLPGFGINPDTFFPEFVDDWGKMKSATGDEWKAFKDSYETRALQLTRDLNTKAASDPKAKKQQKAALLIVQLLRKPKTDAAARDKLYAEFNEMLTGTGG